MVDPVTLRHLEVVESSQGGRDGSLLDEIDRTVTAMGGRALRAWLLRPLLALERVRDRLDAVEDFAFKTTERGKFRETLKAVQDLERLVARAALGSAGPARSGRAQGIAWRGAEAADDPRRSSRRRSSGASRPNWTISPTCARRSRQRSPTTPRPWHATAAPSATASTRASTSCASISRGGRQVIAQMEEQERARTGIPLKIRYNRVFGYYIEVTKSNLHGVPPDYHRKQTIAGGERYITPALKEYEEKVLGADERILEREIELFERAAPGRRRRTRPASRTRRGPSRRSTPWRRSPRRRRSTTTPSRTSTTATSWSIVDGRHPVVERHASEPFVPNDTHLNSATHQLVILTGPNMGGKSTYLRQTALVCLLAQVGSFVPAREAKVAIVDRIFARVGASDNIARGQSTFMVEMQETANILHAATSRSLVILDEIGRGTATFDGLSIAWAVAEHLATSARARPKTIFATHYHELTDLADGIAGRRQLPRGRARVARRDHLPAQGRARAGRTAATASRWRAWPGCRGPVVDRAREILGALEHDELARGGRPSISRTPTEPQQQLGLFQSPSPAGDRVVERLLALDPNRMTPIEALSLLAELKKDAQES